jgi:acetyl esterase
MELDKRAAKLLKILRRQTPMPQQTAQQVREAMLKAGNPFAPPAVELNYIRDHFVERPETRLLLREYSAVAHNESSPCVLFFHGGGFVIGSVAEYDTICSQLAHLSAARVFSLEYRRAPEVKYPVPHHDAYAAYQWLLKHRFRLHLSKIAVCGDSAGGN